MPGQRPRSQGSNHGHHWLARPPWSGVRNAIELWTRMITGIARNSGVQQKMQAKGMVPAVATSALIDPRLLRTFRVLSPFAD